VGTSSLTPSSSATLLLEPSEHSSEHSDSKSELVSLEDSEPPSAQVWGVEDYCFRAKRLMHCVGSTRCLGGSMEGQGESKIMASKR